MKTDTRENDRQPLPVAHRLIVILITSYVADKLWRHRAIVSEQWYSQNQTRMQQSLIMVFEYILVMGAAFLVGFFFSTIMRVLHVARR